MRWLDWPQRIQEFLSSKIWEIEPERRSRLSAIRLLQFSIMLVEGFVRDHLLLRASALTYFTVLSVVPLLAVVVAIASAVGVGSQSFVEWAVGTVAAGAPGAEETLRTLIEGVDFTGSGTLGGGVLFVMTVLAIGNVESTFNHIWGVASGRGWARRFSDYLAVIVVAPLLGGVALSWVAAINSQWAASALSDVAVLGLLYEVGGKLVPVVMLWVAFGFLYWFLPNTRVQVLSAVIGGAFAGLTIAMAQEIYVDFSVGAARADRFFGGFALLPLLFAWIYVFWSLVLLGAEIAFAHQNFALYRQEVRGDPAGPAEREAIGLRIAVEVARCFREGGAAPNAVRLADDLLIPVRTVRSVAERLQQVGILSLRLDAEREEAYQLGRPSDMIRVAHVLEALRGHRGRPVGDDRARSQVMALLAEIDGASRAIAMSATLADLVARSASDAPGEPAQHSGARVDPPQTPG